MVTREQLETALDPETNKPFQSEGIDHDIIAINLLRDRIPHDKHINIIQGAEHDFIYLSPVEDAIPFLLEEDLAILADCNMFIDEDYDCLTLYV